MIQDAQGHLLSGATTEAVATSEDFDNHLSIMISASERTRGLMYFLGLVFAALLVVVGQSDLFPWPEIRHEKISKAHLCYVENRDPNQTVPLGESNDKCGPYYDYMENYFISLDPKPFPKDHKFGQSWDAMAERYNLITKEYVEGASIPIPIIGLKIDRNNVFLFASIMMIHCCPVK